MIFMNSSLYFSFRNHILNFLIDYLNCLPNMLKYEADAQKNWLSCKHVMRICCVSPIFNS